MRVLLLFLLAIPVPPGHVLSYYVIEQIGDERDSGFYNVTLTEISYGYYVKESRDVRDGGVNSFTVSEESRFGPGLLKYPLFFFDPKNISNAIWRLVDRILYERNGTRENYTVNIQHSTINLGGETLDTTGIYVHGERIEENRTTTLYVTYRLVNSKGFTYSLSFKVLGSRTYSLKVGLVTRSEEGSQLSLSFSAAFMLLGFISIIALYLLIVRKYRRSLRRKSPWPATSSRIGYILRMLR